MNCGQQHQQQMQQLQAARARRRVALSGRRSRDERYANSKWGAAPAAAALPQPPTHWRRAGSGCRPDADRALKLKQLLNVAASA